MLKFRILGIMLVLVILGGCTNQTGDWAVSYETKIKASGGEMVTRMGKTAINADLPAPRTAPGHVFETQDVNVNVHAPTPTATATNPARDY